MATSTLSAHDLHILEAIQHPESSASISSRMPLIIDPNLPIDPHTSDTLYATISQLERSIIASIRPIERRLSHGVTPNASLLPQYRACVARLDTLVITYPTYASARNNRAQALRCIYTDGVLVRSSQDNEDNEEEIMKEKAAMTILDDLSMAIELLLPQARARSSLSISPSAAHKLALALTQRGAVYHTTSRRLNEHGAKLRCTTAREAGWDAVQFAEQASCDFALAAACGSTLAKALVVVANPTAKLCGEIVKTALQREYEDRVCEGRREAER